MNYKIYAISLFLIVWFVAAPQTTPAFVPAPTKLLHRADVFWRTELYFGRDKNDGTEVSETDWQQFLDEFVTPRFPDGLTVFDGNGQYRLQNGAIVREKSKVLVLHYSPKTRVATGRKIEQIRNEYKRRFRQESVMRVDFRQNVRVSF